MKIIIVADDSKIIQNIVQKSFDENEVLVLRASNGLETIELLKKYSYNISGILLDLNMPQYDGFTVLNFFKDNNLFNKIPVSIISGDDTKETINKAFKYQITDMLNKPFTKENVRNIIYKMINNKA